MCGDGNFHCLHLQTLRQFSLPLALCPLFFPVLSASPAHCPPFPDLLLRYRALWGAVQRRLQVRLQTCRANRASSSKPPPTPSSSPAPCHPQAPKGFRTESSVVTLSIRMIASLLFHSPPLIIVFLIYFYFLQNRSKTELRGSDTFLHEGTKLPTESHHQSELAAGQSCSWVSLFHASFQSSEGRGAAHVGSSSPPGQEERPSALAQGRKEQATETVQRQRRGGSASCGPGAWGRRQGTSRQRPRTLRAERQLGR